MTGFSGKRKSDVLDLTGDSDDASGNHAPKASRTSPSLLNPQSISTAPRFGESADYIPLNQLSQATGVDEEDAQAADLVQSSQDVDESSLASFVLYGTSLPRRHIQD
jgi:SWI/SNF-related matrix-associated actin-dependent regulator of chromatin subfamily A3